MLKRTHALLRAAAARSKGKLRSLDVSGWPASEAGKLWERNGPCLLRDLVRDNGATIESLRVHDSMLCDGLDELAATGTFISLCPNIASGSGQLHCGLSFEYDEGGHDMKSMTDTIVGILRRDPPYAAVSCHKLSLWLANNMPLNLMAAIAAGMKEHGSIDGLGLGICGRFEHDSDVGEMLMEGLQLRNFSSFSSSMVSLPAITLQLPFLQELSLHGPEIEPFFSSGESVVAFITALGASRLIKLMLPCCVLWGEFPIGALLIKALTGLRTLKHLDLSDNSSAPYDAAFMLKELLVHPDCVLEELILKGNSLTSASVSEIFNGVVSNTSLRSLSMAHSGSMTVIMDTIRPALQLNTTLRKLSFAMNRSKDEAWKRAEKELEAAVAARN